MGGEDAFLRAVRDRPEDDTARLVYADWLAERGDPRGELIRAEMMLRDLPVYTDEYRKLKPNRQQLRSAAPAEWLEVMGYRPVHRPMFTALPAARADRWRLAEEFIELWHPPLRPGDGFENADLDDAEARIGRPLPRALREWYGFAGRRSDIWSSQDRQILPEDLSLQADGRLVIRHENQNCARWHVRGEDLDREDPPVYGGDADRMVSPTLSAFALYVLVFEVKFSRQVIWCQVHAQGPDQPVIPPQFRRAALPRWYWFDYEVSFWEDTDLVVENDYQDQWWASCRTEDSYERLVDRCGDAVERL